MPYNDIAESDVPANAAFAPLTESYLRSCRYANLVTYSVIATQGLLQA
jgi:hypothetical protein